MIPLLFLTLLAPAQECRSSEFDPGPLSMEQAFREGTDADVRGAWDRGWGRAVASLSYSDSTGLRVRVYSEEGDSAEMASIAGILDESLIVQLREDEPLRLLIHDGSDFDLRTVDEFTTCSPQIRDRLTAANDLREVVRGRNIRETTVLRPWVRVDVDGRVVEARLDQGSGSFSLDAAVLDLVRGWRFEPARNEGIPVMVWVAFPVTLRAGRGG
jgi:TonB family protein